ncbi:MAG: bifunctional metallophosphatase/5'-nucleotidase, partial [Paludibacteraceae bacterium]|nr:bifunctional metallophosphatase/5'-nucleotidase [Paludibacteraceae bacterium]
MAAFIRNSIVLLVALFFVACIRQKEVIILSTNDTHSQIDADFLSDNYVGGYTNRIALIDSVRQTEKELLLLDAGDIFQGTPYFNFFGGRVEIEAYSKMGYDA